MPKDDRDILKVLKFELSFLQDGGYGRSPRAAWRPSLIFEDSPTCLNFNDPDRPNPCGECLLMQFVPPEHRSESSPCRFIQLNGHGETVDSLYRWGTQSEMEDALRKWLRETITWYEAEHKMGGTDRRFDDVRCMNHRLPECGGGLTSWHGRRTFMLSKCANPSCFGTLRYLHEGRIFHLELQTATEQSGTVDGRSQIERFWLCEECSRNLTLIPHQAGVLAVPLQRTHQPSRTTNQPEKGDIMPFEENRDRLLQQLKREPVFLNSRKSRTPSLFENSPICLNSGGSSPRRRCSECGLFQFVPSGRRAESVPCRHIPLNLSGDTLDGLYGYVSDRELQENLVDWLCEKIAHLESERAHAEAGESRMEMR